MFKKILYLPILFIYYNKSKKIIRKNNKTPDFYTESDKYGFVYKLAKNILKSLSVKLEFHNIENISNSSTLIIGNHESYLDPLCILIAYMDSKRKKRIGFISKKELEKKWLFKPFGKLIDVIYLDRESIKQAIQAFNDAKSLINNKKIPILIFPEGTRNEKKELLEFKSGALKIAYRSGAPIQMVTIVNSHNCYKNLTKNKIIHVYFHKEIKFHNYSHINTVKLSNRIRLEMQNKKNELISKYY